jgi:hypothetical protein
MRPHTPRTQTTSEKALRKQLQKHFGVDMTDKKAFIKQQVRSCVRCCCRHVPGMRLPHQHAHTHHALP